MEPIPAPIERYLAAENAHDPEAMTACFTPEGEVADEGEILQGYPAILAWARRVINDFRPRSDVTSVRRSGPEVIVGTTISGTFEGSPLDFQLTFVVEGDLIARYKAEVLG
jgi:SnoaL-like domain